MLKKTGFFCFVLFFSPTVGLLQWSCGNERGSSSKELFKFTKFTNDSLQEDGQWENVTEDEENKQFRQGMLFLVVYTTAESFRNYYTQHTVILPISVMILCVSISLQPTVPLDSAWWWWWWWWHTRRSRLWAQSGAVCILVNLSQWATFIFFSSARFWIFSDLPLHLWLILLSRGCGCVGV